MRVKKGKKLIIAILVSVMLLLSGNLSYINFGIGRNGADSMTVKAYGIQAGNQPEYYVQCYNDYSGTSDKQDAGPNDNNNPKDTLKTTIPISGLNLSANQSVLSRRINNSNDDSNPGQPVADDTGKYWGRYYTSSMDHRYYNSSPKDGGWYNTAAEGSPFATSLWAETIIYKFEVEDSNTDYDIFVGANATNSDIWAFENRTAAIYINDELTASTVITDLSQDRYGIVTGVKAQATDTDTGLSNIITLTIRKDPDSTNPSNADPAISFIMIAKSSAPVVFSADTSSIAYVGMDAEVPDLPATIEVITTAGVMNDVPVTYSGTGSDTTDFFNPENRKLFITVPVTGLATIGDAASPVTVKVQFIQKGGVHYYANAGVPTGGNIAQETFNAIKTSNVSTLKNTTVMDQESTAAAVWGYTAGGTVDGSNTDDPYAIRRYTEDGSPAGAIRYRFTDLPAGKYLIHLGATDSTRNTGVWAAEGEASETSIGTMSITGGVRSLTTILYEKTANESTPLSIAVHTGAGPRVGFIVIADFVPSTDFGGDDPDQAYFFDSGNSGKTIPVEGISLPKNQSAASRFLNSATAGTSSTGAAIADLTGKYWGAYYSNEMTGNGYYNTGASTTDFYNPNPTSLFDTVMGTNLAEAGRQLIFKFELEAEKTYDVVIGAGVAMYEYTANQRGGAVYINDDTAVSATWVNQEYRHAVHIAGVEAEETDADTGLSNILTITIKRLVPSGDRAAYSDPQVSFISIRETGKTPVSLTACETKISADLEADLPAETEIMTTAGMKTADVSYTDRTAFDSADRKLFETVYVTATLSQGGTDFSAKLPVTFVVSSVHYFANMTLYDSQDISGNNVYYSTRVFGAMMAANTATMKNTVPDKRSSGNSDWGMTTSSANVSASSAFDDSPYKSFKSGDTGQLIYNFPNLEAGQYLIQIGINDPWGFARETEVSINNSFDDPDEGPFLGTMVGRQFSDVLTSFVYTQGADNDRLRLIFSGASDNPLVGFIIIREIPTDGTANEISIETRPMNFFFELGEALNLDGLTILVDMGDYSYKVIVTPAMIQDYSNITEYSGLRTVTIEYMNKTASYNITVLGDNPPPLPVDPGGENPGGEDPGGENPGGEDPGKDAGNIYKNSVPAWAIGLSAGLAVLITAGAIVYLLLLSKKKTAA